MPTAAVRKRRYSILLSTVLEPTSLPTHCTSEYSSTILRSTNRPSSGEQDEWRSLVEVPCGGHSGGHPSLCAPLSSWRNAHFLPHVYTSRHCCCPASRRAVLKIGTIQRRLALPLHLRMTNICSERPASAGHIFVHALSNTVRSMQLVSSICPVLDMRDKLRCQDVECRSQPGGCGRQWY